MLQHDKKVLMPPVHVCLFQFESKLFKTVRITVKVISLLCFLSYMKNYL